MIGFVGGTGPDGMGLALRFAMAGNPVLIGSRNARRARDAADSVTALADGTSGRGRTQRGGVHRVGRGVRHRPLRRTPTNPGVQSL